MHDDAQLDSLSTPTPDPDRFARSCASSCPFTWCTGRGSTDYRAHRCSFAPDVVPELGPCSIVDCPEPATFVGVNGRRCDGHTPPQPKRGEPTRPNPVPLAARVYGSTPCNVRSCKVHGHG